MGTPTVKPSDYTYLKLLSKDEHDKKYPQSHHGIGYSCLHHLITVLFEEVGMPEPWRARGYAWASYGEPGNTYLAGINVVERQKGNIKVAFAIFDPETEQVLEISTDGGNVPTVRSILDIKVEIGDDDAPIDAEVFKKIKLIAGGNPALYSGLPVFLHEGLGVEAVAVSSDTSLVASISNNDLCLWNAATGQQLAKKKFQYAWLRGVAFSADNTKVATGHNFIFIFDTKTGKKLKKLAEKNFKEIHHMCFSPTGKWLAATAPIEKGSAIVIWDVESGEIVAKFPTRTREEPEGCDELIFSADETELIASAEHHIYRFDMKEMKLHQQVKIFGNDGKSNMFSVTADRIYRGNYYHGDPVTRSIHVLDLHTLEIIDTIIIEEKYKIFDVSQDGKLLAFTLRIENGYTIRVMDLATRSTLLTHDVYYDGYGYNNGLRISPDNKYVVTSVDSNLYRFDIDSQLTQG